MTSHLPNENLRLVGSRYESSPRFLGRDFALKRMQTCKAGFLQKFAAVPGPDVQKHLGGVLGRSDTAEILPVSEHVELHLTFPWLVRGHRSLRPDSDNARELFVHRLLGSLERRARLLDVNPGPAVLVRMQMNAGRDRKRERLRSIPSLVNTHGTKLHNATNANQRGPSRLVPRVRKESWRTGN